MTADKRKRIQVIIAEQEYQSEITAIPLFKIGPYKNYLTIDSL